MPADPNKNESKSRTIINRVRRSDGFLATGGPILLLELLFFVGPLLIMFFIATMRMENLALEPAYTLENYVGVFTGSANRLAFVNTTMIAVLTTVTAVVVAYPFAYYIARFGGQYQNLLLILVMIPFWTNYIVRIYGWQIILGSRGVLNSALIWMGVINEPISWLINTKFSIWLGLTYLWLPFMVLPLYSSLEKIDEDLIEAAYDLGASRLAVFRRIVLPLSIPGLVGGIIFVFIFSMGAYIVPAMIGGGELFVGTRIEYTFGIGGNWPMGAALGSVLMLIVAGVLWTLMGYTNVEEMF
ncbi:ABC transporter permease [Natronosalvus halobius]|uniref:ABC transporter permease n=1 Tax=Natronosalvus halobius TaxID=2953746 RepID=UPI00209EF659|nr:ABC transporter permease [Natronosalvus halobius]USZ73712.1 ABC transporter permease [Natronosalvus halobius]